MSFKDKSQLTWQSNYSDTKYDRNSFEKDKNKERPLPP